MCVITPLIHPLEKKKIVKLIANRKSVFFISTNFQKRANDCEEIEKLNGHVNLIKN